jgi:hypothetical protein
MPAGDRHAPRRDLGGAKLIDAPVSERPHRLREQPAQLRHGLGFSTMLRQVEVDQLAQGRCLDEALFATQPVECSRERLGCRLLACESAPLCASRTTPAASIAVGQRLLPFEPLVFSSKT